MDTKLNVREVFDKYIKGTKNKEHVRLMDIYVNSLSIKISKKIKSKFLKVYITTKALKHIHDRHCYDKDQSDLVEEIINNLPSIIAAPDIIRKNKVGKPA